MGSGSRSDESNPRANDTPERLRERSATLSSVRRRALLGLFLAAGAAGAAFMGPIAAPRGVAHAAEPARHTYVVAAMGDSLTDPKSNGGLYLKYLAARCPESRFDSYGKGGEMVNQM